MCLRISEVISRKDLKKFVVFPNRLYAGCPYYVPPLIREEMGVFSRKKSPVFENAEAKLFLAFRDGEVVGRIAAILSHAANDKFKTKNLRFGWFDAIDDYEVAQALFEAAEQWGRSRGMETITGPHGFNDFDKWGMIIEGHDTVPTFSSYYNHPYYVGFMDRYGFEKDADAFEYRIKNLQTNAFPERPAATAERIAKRKGYSLLKFRSRRELLNRAGEMLDLIEDCYSELYGVVPLSATQRDYYVRKYFRYLDPELMKIAVNRDNTIIGVLVALPSLSRGLQKANGRLFPFGLLRLLLDARRTKVVDFLLAAVHKGYRGRGIDVIMGVDMFNTIRERGFEEGESNPELEANTQVRAEWQVAEHVLMRRRRIFKKRIPAQNARDAASGEGRLPV